SANRWKRKKWGEEEEDSAVFGITLHREPVLQNPDSADPSPAYSCVQYHTVKVRRLKAGTLERLVVHLLDPERRESDFIHVFLSTYKAFTASSTLIDLVERNGNFCHQLISSAVPLSPLVSLVQLWLEEYSEDFREPPQYPTLGLLCAYMRRPGMGSRRLFSCHLCPDSTGSRLSASEHHSESLANSDPVDGGGICTKPDKSNFVDFSAKEVAEQLTRLDAELFVKVVPFDCLGCIWSQRDKKENRNLAPTVRATISQFNAVTNRVITSLLCPLPVHRARIIERWIAIAQECRQLKNFSSLRAILSALQSNAVYRLKKTWAAVSSFSFPPQSFSSGIVPYLGTYLTVLTMLDTALTDSVEVSSLFHPLYSGYPYDFPAVSRLLLLHFSKKLTGSPLLSLQSLTGSLHNVAEDLSTSPSSSPSLSRSSCSSSHPDLSSSSLGLSPECSSSSSSSQSCCSPQAVLPVYNKQVADSCIIRVSVECVNNGNVYKSILLTSQDHTPHVIQRALEKHNMEDFRCSDFSIYQMLNHGKELQIPDKANVFYAMCTSANYDFVLRQRWKRHGKHSGFLSSPGAQHKRRHNK
uniref:Ral guanine nucleotide dissociation stimulator-like 3a n=1 Tax=Nothobranchius furzeri TaxID=105023 RepID=A0A8C6L9Z1_NOTFU